MINKFFSPQFYFMACYLSRVFSTFFGNYIRRCALTDPQSNYFLLKFPRPYYFKIYLYNWLLTPLLFVLLSKTVYCTWFGKQRSRLHIRIEIFLWTLLHLLDINILMFVYVHLCMHVKYSMWPFSHNQESLTLLWMDSP